MESRLPKPTAVKRPMPPNKPSDRIKANSSALTASTTGTSSNSSNQTLPPLSRNLLNLPQVLSRHGGKSAKRLYQSKYRNIYLNSARAASPDPGKPTGNFPNRTKLRRSRSASDVSEMRLNLKRAGAPTLSTIPNKFTRNAAPPAPAANPAATSSVGRLGMRAGSNPPKRPVAAATSSSTLPAGAAARAKASRPAVSATSKAKPAVAAAANVATKHIAKYDFKARFQDLLEKHKALRAKMDKQMEEMGELEGLPIQLEETQNKLIELESMLKNTQTDKECLQRQVKQHTSKIETITSSLGRTKEELNQLKTTHQHIAAEHATLSVEVLDLRQRNEQLMRHNEQLAGELAVCREQLFQSNMERKELHNTVMDLRGNIRVFCRVRPPLDVEQTRHLCSWTYHDEATVELQSIDGQAKNKIGQQLFTFDQVFHPNSNQNEIFEMVAPLIQSALDGYNICIFAYGQTGSGKTYTMDGVSGNVGVIPRTVDLLFDSIKNYRHLGWEYELKATFLEIYNEVLYDLLSNEQKEMEIRMVKNSVKNDIYVSNITEETVRDPDHLRELMHLAKMNRATAATAGNERSSRSHAVTKLELIGRHAEKQETCVGSINLVDLAGSESPKTSTRMTETKNINRSLSELTNVILALLQKQDHIPYRNSKLTHLLMPSLGGNSKTLMFINVSPFQDCFQESVKSLRFAASVNSCKMAKAKRNRFLNSSNASNNSSCEK
ncbi:hypothetical protein KR044_001000 [Drosophila immigrans]|nr:hypothetical protein KR044_001000 [Drosophila immigrans]